MNTEHLGVVSDTKGNTGVLLASRDYSWLLGRLSGGSRVVADRTVECWRAMYAGDSFIKRELRFFMEAPEKDLPLMNLRLVSLQDYVRWPELLQIWRNGPPTIHSRPLDLMVYRTRPDSIMEEASKLNWHLAPGLAKFNLDVERWMTDSGHGG